METLEGLAKTSPPTQILQEGFTNETANEAKEAQRAFVALDLICVESRVDVQDA